MQRSAATSKRRGPAKEEAEEEAIYRSPYSSSSRYRETELEAVRRSSTLQTRRHGLSAPSSRYRPHWESEEEPHWESESEEPPRRRESQNYAYATRIAVGVAYGSAGVAYESAGFAYRSVGSVYRSARSMYKRVYRPYWVPEEEASRRKESRNCADYAYATGAAVKGLYRSARSLYGRIHRPPSHRVPENDSERPRPKVSRGCGACMFCAYATGFAVRIVYLSVRSLYRGARALGREDEQRRSDYD